MFYIYSSQRWLDRVLYAALSTFMLLGVLELHAQGVTACTKPVAGKDTTICTTSAQLKAPASGEVWSFLSSSNNSAATITSGGLASNMTVTGQYRFLLKKDGDANCSDTVTVTKNNFLIAKLPDDDICPGTTLTFGYQGLSNVTYLWSTGATTEAISVKPSQTTEYTVTVTSNTSGCVIKDTVKITVNPKPNAGQDKVVCEPTTTVAAAGQGETWSFLSFNDPGNQNNTDAATIDPQGNVASLDKAGFYRFVLTNDKGCKDTIRIQRRIVTLPKITIPPACPGTMLTFGYNNTTDFSYAWNTGQTTAQISVTPTQNTDYIVTATELSTSCTAKDTVKVTLKPAPVLTLVSSVCTQNNAKYITTVTTTNGATITSNAGVVSGSGTNFTVTTGSDTTQFTITATLDGCRTRLVINKPDCSCPTIANPSGQGTATCIGTSATISASGCTSGTSLKWYSNQALTTEITTGVSGNNLTTANLNANTDFYAACVDNTKPICKSSGVKITVTVKPYPTFGNINTNCASNNSSYTVNVSSTGVVTVKSPNGPTVSGTGPYQISNIPAGQSLVLTSTLNGCSKDTTITAPNCGCTPTTPSALAANVGICEGDPIPNPTFTAIVGPNTTIDWYNAQTGGTILQSNSLTFSPTAAGTYYLQAKSTAQGCNNEVNPVRVPVTLAIGLKPTFKVEAKDPTCQASTPQNNGSVRIVTGTIGHRYKFNTTGFGSLPTTATGSDTLKVLPTVIAQNIANDITTTTYYIRVFSNEGCYKDTSVSVRPTTCQPNCPTITLLNPNASNEACSGPSYLYAGAQPVIKTSQPADSIRFVYFTAATTDPYTGGTLMGTVLANPSDSIATLDNGLAGLQSNRLPVNNGNAPITYFVYAIRKTPVAGTPCPPPFAGLTYTLNPLPKFELDSIPACVGDTTYKVNVKINSAGTFTIVVAEGVGSVGGGPNPFGVSQTINNAPGNGATTQVSLKTTGNFVILVEDAKGCRSVLLAPQPSFKECGEETFDLALSKSIDKKKAAVGDFVQYTIKVWNEGTGTATGVSVRDTLNAGVVYETHATAFGNYNSNTKIWTIGSIAPGDTVALLIVGKVVAQGVWFNTAEICTMNEDDDDSTPCNSNDDEDDIDRACFSVPVTLCPTEALEITVPANYINVKWTKDNDPNFTLTGNVVLLSAPGIYRFTASNGTCPAEGCCPVEIVSGECCPADICVPFVIKQTKRGGKSVK